MNRFSIYLNGCVALAACFAGMGWNAARAQQSKPGTIVEKGGGIIVPSSKGQAPQQSPQQSLPATVQSAAGISLDVVGIKSGMTVREAMLALKADNPRLTLTPQTRQFEGFAEPLLISVIGRESVTQTRSGEQVAIAFTTMPLGQEVVWGVSRTYNFVESERPPMQAILDALHKKYGTETVPADPDPRMGTKAIVWVYDGGMPLGPRGTQLSAACGGSLAVEMEDGGASLLNFVQSSAKPWPAECKSFIRIDASVQATRDPASSQFVVVNLTVILSDASRYRTSLEATRAVVQGAAKGREKKQTDEVNKRGAPKL